MPKKFEKSVDYEMNLNKMLKALNGLNSVVENLEKDLSPSDVKAVIVPFNNRIVKVREWVSAELSKPEVQVILNETQELLKTEEGRKELADFLKTRK